MSLTVIAGLPGSDGRSRLFGKLAGAVVDGRSGLLVAPSSAGAARLRAELAEATPVGLRSVGFARLIETEWLLQGDGRRIVPPMRREVLLARCLGAAGVAERPGPGAIALLGTLVSRACAQGPVSAVPSREGLAGRLLHSLTTYLAMLREEGLVEPSEATRLLATCAPPADLIAFDSFTALSPDRVTLLAGWSRAGGDVMLTLPWRRGCAATQPLDALIDELVSLGASIIEAGITQPTRPPELLRVVTGLFSAGPPAAAQGRVGLRIARGDEAEARMIADRVAAELLSGVPADRIAVAFSEPERHTGWLARAFDDSGIEAAWDVRVPVAETPLGRSMLRLWSLASGPMSREDFSALLRSPFSGVDVSRADRADVTWRARRVQGRALLDLAGSAGRLVSACERLSDKPLTLETARKWKSIADTLMANAYGHDAPVPGLDGALDAAVHRAFCQALSSACVSGQGGVTPAELWAAFAATSVSPASGSVTGGVLVTSIRRLGLREFDSVVIGGLTAGETPRQGSDDRLEGEAVRQVVRVLKLAHDPEEQARGERLAFYLAVATARSSLTLVRRESDDEGRALRASVFWDEFLDLYREPGSGTGANECVPETITSTADAPLGSKDGVCAVRGLLQNDRSLSLLSEIDAVSPGEIEKYAACPYSWFVERRLRPRTPDAAVDLLTAGQVAHAALAEFYRRWPEASGSRRVVSGTVDLATQRMAEISGEAVRSAPAPANLEEEWLLSSVEPSVIGLVARDARFLPDYEPAELEWSFGLQEGDEPIDLGGVRVKGRADRIDIGPQGLIVIDYKRSRANSLSQIREGGLVQLQLYALAASQRLGLPVAGGLYRSLARDDDRGFVSNGVVGTFKPADVIDEAEIRELLEAAVQTARDAMEGMRAGHIEPSPSGERCGYCPALSFCPEGVRS